MSMRFPPHSGPTSLRVELPAQPDDTSCGPTCLHAMYRYFGDHVPLEQLIAEIPSLETGGTLAVLLGNHALKRGYDARLYSFNVKVFDPTWFELNQSELLHKLESMLPHQSSRKRLPTAIRAYAEFLRLGGEVRFRDLSGRLIRKYLDRGIPILTGLSSTWLYRTMREIPDTNADDDLRGEPAGHFVVLSGYDTENREVHVADPYSLNPISPERHYAVKMDRLVTAILLGVLTYDGNLLILCPKK